MPDVILGFVGHIASAMKQLCHCSTKVAIDNIYPNKDDSVPVKLYYKVGSILNLAYRL